MCVYSFVDRLWSDGSKAPRLFFSYYFSPSRLFDIIPCPCYWHRLRSKCQSLRQCPIIGWDEWKKAIAVSLTSWLVLPATPGLCSSALRWYMAISTLSRALVMLSQQALGMHGRAGFRLAAVLNAYGWEERLNGQRGGCCLCSWTARQHALPVQMSLV